MEDIMGMGGMATMVAITHSAGVAAPQLLTVSGGSVSVTVALRRDMAGVSRTGQIRGAGLITLTLLLSAWTPPAARGWI